MKKISIDPITRLEGHGRIDIFLNDDGNVENAYFVIPELRGFEKFCEGRPVEELARITPRICGVCPEAHHMASAKAADAVYGVDIPSPAKKLREMFYNAFFAGDHTTHFYALGGPDFVMGPDAAKAERNIIGVIGKVGAEIGKKVIRQRWIGHRVARILGGKTTHPICAIVGGMSKGLTNKEDWEECVKMADETVEFAKFSLDLFDKIVLQNKDYVDLIVGDTYTIKTYYMGLVDDNNKANFYDGKIRVVDQEGNEFVKFAANDYLDVLDEHVESWSYLKFPYLKKVGWKGIVDGKDSGVYSATPLSRCNAADGMATPLAQEAYDKMYETLGGKPVHHTLAIHWARLVELMYSAERFKELVNDEEIQSDNIRAVPTETPSEGVGVVEAPRGTLYHHYWTDENGMVKKANLIVGTTNNNAPISLTVKNAAKQLIKDGEVNDGILNMVEMAFRSYDPCYGCATHSLPGQMPLVVRILDKDKNVYKELKQFVD